VARAAVAAPVPAAPCGPGHGPIVSVVALEAADAQLIHELADPLRWIEEHARRVETGRRLVVAVGVDHRDALAEPAHRARWWAASAVESDAALGRAEHVHDLDAEARC